MKTFRPGVVKMKSLQNKVALVTGASKGIGAEIARELAARGAAVAVNYSGSKQAADAVVASIEAAGGKAFAVQADLSDPARVQPMIEAVANRFGPIDVLVNNAGVYDFAPLEQVTPEHFHRQFNINVLGLLLVTQAAVARFNPLGGSIVNISSVAADGLPSAAVYGASKAAVDSITVSLSKELGPRQIRVNSINPGFVETDGTHAAGFVGSDFQSQLAAQTPLGRTGQPGDIATVAAFLSSNDAAWVSGQIIHVAGGNRV